MVLKLGEARAIRLLVSPQVMHELEGALRRKAPQALGALALILERSGVEITESPPKETIQDVLNLVDHLGDARILAAGLTTGVDYFITLDKEHFLENRVVMESTSIPIGAPGDFLAWFQKKLKS